MKGKIIVIEGTDCSGKETQSKLLKERLEKAGRKVACISFPMYDTPTGKIIGACLLGKPEISHKYLKEEHCFFKDGGVQDSLTALCYYAADRRYNLPTINKYLEEGYTLIIDRYVPSNMAHRGGMLEVKEERLKMYKKIETLEYEILELPRPDHVILLYMPHEYTKILKNKRNEEADEVEKNEEYQRRSEEAYLELAAIYNFDIVNCIKDEKIRTTADIHEEVFALVERYS